jgi:F0F1-type ATP synthase gamma subunit
MGEEEYMESGMDKDTLLLIFGAVMSLCGFVGSFMLARHVDQIKELKKADADLDYKIVAHREDVLKNYVTSSDLNIVKTDIIARIDKMEKALLNRRVGGR